MRKRGGRKRALGMRAPIALPIGPNERWSLDFVSDSFTDSRRFRMLAVVDDFTRECLALIAGHIAVGGARGARTGLRSIARRGRPKMMRFRQRHGVHQHGDPEVERRRAASTGTTSQPGKPQQNAFAESFIGRLRDECLNETAIRRRCQKHASVLEAWRDDYNRVRPTFRTRQPHAGGGGSRTAPPELLAVRAIILAAGCGT